MAEKEEAFILHEGNNVVVEITIIERPKNKQLQGWNGHRCTTPVKRPYRLRFPR